VSTSEEIDVSDWVVVGGEQMGEPGKDWVEDPETGVRWLFKPVRMQHDARGDFRQGDDWAEKVAADLASVLGIPAARVELAVRGSALGAISCDLASGYSLSLGNEVLSGQDPSYPGDQLGTVQEYTVVRIFDALAAAGVEAGSVPEASPQTAQTVFAGYLVFDAWIANTDRHHGNWGILEDLGGGGAPRLSPSFDHGSSLGFQLRDEAKGSMVEQAKGVERWANRGRCRPMAGRPNLVRLALESVERAGSTAEFWLHRLTELAPEQWGSVLRAVPDARMSHVSRTFAYEVLEANRRRLLDGR
jgi:hypothetical protein